MTPDPREAGRGEEGRATRFADTVYGQGKKTEKRAGGGGGGTGRARSA